MHVTDFDDSLSAGELIEEVDAALAEQTLADDLGVAADTAACGVPAAEPQDAESRPSFEDLGLPEVILKAVRDLRYTEPTPVQEAAIPHVLAGRDLLAAAQTGTGKTAAFLLPAMGHLGHVASRGRGRRSAEGRGPKMLVITPTRELAQQIDEVCGRIATRTKHLAVTVVGGVSYNPQKSALRRGCDILVATPGRLIDLVEQGSCDLGEVEVLVIDEADRMLDMGFLPAVRQIVEMTPSDRQTLLFSATLDEKTMGSIGGVVRDPARVEIAPATATAETVDQFVLPVSFDSKNDALVQVLKREGSSRVIVFMRTKHRADSCCRRLTRAGISAEAIHGDRSQAQRERALRAFRSGRSDVIVATDVLARGIDISDVSYVINFDVPGEPTDYIHRIGRTGRAGEIGWALTFVTRQDMGEFLDIESLMGKTADLFDASGIDVGDSAPDLDPDRVPAARGGRRRTKRGGRSRAAAPRRPGPSGRGTRGGRETEGRREGGGRETAAPGAAPRPARPKRSGSARVRVPEGTSERSGERESAGSAEHRDARRRDRRADDERGRRRGGQQRRGREEGRGGRGARDSGAAHDWRNRDLPEERRGQGRRGAPSASRSARSGRTRSGDERRPGDQGGRR